jgi:hypothetical protein
MLSTNDATNGTRRTTSRHHPWMSFEEPGRPFFTDAPAFNSDYAV